MHQSGNSLLVTFPSLSAPQHNNQLRLPPTPTPPPPSLPVAEFSLPSSHSLDSLPSIIPSILSAVDLHAAGTARAPPDAPLS